MSTYMKPFWKQKWGKNKICNITHTRIRPGKNKQGQPHTVYLECKHGFYRKALAEWVKNCTKLVPTCPVCRKQFHPNLCT